MVLLGDWKKAHAASDLMEILDRHRQVVFGRLGDTDNAECGVAETLSVNCI